MKKLALVCLLLAALLLTGCSTTEGTYKSAQDLLARSLYTEADGLSRSAVVVPAADLADIRYVYVITDFGGDS